LNVFQWQADYFRGNGAMGWVFHYFEAIRAGNFELAKKIVQRKYDQNKKAENQRRVEKVLSDSEKTELDTVVDPLGKKGVDARLVVQKKAVRFMENWTNGVFMMIEQFSNPASSRASIAGSLLGREGYGGIFNAAVQKGEVQNVKIVEAMKAKTAQHQKFVDAYAEKNDDGSVKKDANGDIVWLSGWQDKLVESLGDGYKNDAGKEHVSGITIDDMKHVNPVVVSEARLREYYAKMGLDTTGLDTAGTGFVVFTVDQDYWTQFQKKLGHDGAEAFADQQFQYKEGTLLHTMGGASYIPVDPGKDLRYEYLSHEIFHPLDHLKNEPLRGRASNDQAVAFILGEAVRELKAYMTGAPADNIWCRISFETVYQPGGAMYQGSNREEVFKIWLREQQLQYTIRTWQSIFSSYLPDWIENKLKLQDKRAQTVRTRAEDLMKGLADAMLDMVNAGEATQRVFALLNSFEDGQVLQQVDAFSAAHAKAKKGRFHDIVDKMVNKPEAGAGSGAIQARSESRTVAVPTRSELRTAEPVAVPAAVASETVRGIGIVTPKALQKFLLNRALANLGARGITFPVRPEFALPGDPNMKPGKLGYYDETTKRTVLSDAHAQMLAAQFDGQDTAMMDPLQLDLLQARLFQIEKELQVLLRHEQEHSLGRSESGAYAAALEEAELVGLEAWKKQVLVSLRDREALRERSKVPDMVQIILGTGMVTDRLTAEEIISNALNAKLYQYGDQDLKRSDVEDLGGQLESLVKRIEGAPPSMTFEHHLLLIRQDQITAEVETLLAKLVKRGFVIGVYTSDDKSQPDGVKQIYGIAQLAAWLGRTQFVDLLKNEIPGGYDSKNGRLQFKAYLANALVQILLSEIMSVQQVAVAA